MSDLFDLHERYAPSSVGRPSGLPGFVAKPLLWLALAAPFLWLFNGWPVTTIIRALTPAKVIVEEGVLIEDARDRKLMILVPRYAMGMPGWPRRSAAISARLLCVRASGPLGRQLKAAFAKVGAGPAESGVRGLWGRFEGKLSRRDGLLEHCGGERAGGKWVGWERVGGQLTLLSASALRPVRGCSPWVLRPNGCPPPPRNLKNVKPPRPGETVELDVELIASATPGRIMTSCTIMEPSGHPHIDARACRDLAERERLTIDEGYSNPRDRRSRTIERTYTYKVTGLAPPR